MGAFSAGVLLLCSAAHALSDIALGSLAQQGKHHELIALVEKALEDKEDVSSFQLLMLGGSYYQVRQYRRVLATADAMAKRIAEGDSSYFGGDLSPTPTIFRAQVALDLGDFNEAARLGNQALAAVKSGIFQRFQLIEIGNLLGVANAFLGRTAEARRQIEAIRAVSTSMSNLQPEKFAAMARIHMSLKEYDKALAAITDPGANVSGFLTVFYDPTFQNLPKHFIRAKSLFEMGRFDDAKAGYDALLKQPQIAQYGGIYWLTLHDRARIALRDGDAAGAIEMLRRAVEVIEQQRSSIDSETGRIGFVGDKQAVYQLLVGQLIARGDAAGAFEYVERSKSRALVDLLASHRGLRAPAARAEAARTLADLAVAEHEVLAQPAPTDATRGARTRSVVADLRGRLRTEAPELAALVTVTGTRPEAIQPLLAADEALVEYFYSADELFAFVVDRASVRAVKLDRPRLEEDVLAFRRCLAEPALGDCTDRARPLHARLFAPVAAGLAQRKLIVVPHGVLHYLPFPALHDGSAWVIDAWSIRIQPSASVLDLIRDRGQRVSSGALVLGNPDLRKDGFDLKHAEEEAAAVSKLVPGARVLLRQDATRSAVRADGHRYATVHFATHGVFDPDRPLDSALLLAPEAGSDGRLTVADLYSLELSANLVTLSACETALGQVASGDDVVGFTRGLLYAGASSIVSSLWSVDDLATRDLMVRFYTDLPTLGKQEALRRAQLAVKSARPQPFFWAAFVLTGNAN